MGGFSKTLHEVGRGSKFPINSMSAPLHYESSPHEDINSFVCEADLGRRSWREINSNLNKIGLKLVGSEALMTTLMQASHQETQLNNGETATGRKIVMLTEGEEKVGVGRNP